MLRIYGSAVPRAKVTTLNGYIINTDQMKRSWNCDDMVVKQLRSANAVFRTLRRLRSQLGVDTPARFVYLYKSLVLSQFGYTQECNFDVSRGLMSILRNTQKLQIRSMVGVHSKTPTAILFRDCRMLWFQHHLISTALKYLSYLLNTPPTHPVRAALTRQTTLKRG